MARIETDPNYTTPTFSRATAATDIFKKEDVQGVAAALSTHDHSTGKGLPLVAGAIPSGTITSAMIADGTIDTLDLKDGSVTSAKILDGTIATGDLADNTVTLAKMDAVARGAIAGAQTSLLVNGGFEVWQRGAGAFATAGYMTADRWINQSMGTDSLSIAKDTANTDGGGSGACAAATFSLGTGGGQSILYQPFRIADSPMLRGRPVTFSVRVKTSTANAINLAYYDGGGWTYSATTLHPGGASYQTMSFTFTPLNTAGSDIHVGISFKATCTAYIDNAMLVPGTVAADYVPVQPADELMRCQRYYETITSKNGQALFTGVCTSVLSTGQYFPFKVTKAITPTITFAAGQWIGQRHDTGGQQSTGPAFYNATADGVHIYMNSTMGAGIIFFFYANTSDGLFKFEANP
jgi:hypothetical protein